jgi:hypothetical protein
MSIVSNLLDVANVLNLIAVLLLMRAVVKDRNMLKGFSTTGAFLTFIALFCFELAYVFLQNPVSFALGSVTLVFWLIVFIFSLRITMDERRN